MGFSHVDVCFALRHWHSASLRNHFPAERKGNGRTCGCVHLLRPSEPTTVLFSALQPSRRGVWCRADRKKSYRLGDVSLLVVRLAVRAREGARERGKARVAGWVKRGEASKLESGDGAGGGMRLCACACCCAYECLRARAEWTEWVVEVGQGRALDLTGRKEGGALDREQ
eukprot:3564154-Pleurochrysis_carterae.AAC.1